MKFVIAKAYNGVHKQFASEIRRMGHFYAYVDIDSAEWIKNIKRSQFDVFLWQADDKGKERHLILDRLYLLENQLKRNCYPSHGMYYAFNDKIKQYWMFANLNVDTAETFVAYDKKSTQKFVNKICFPVIIKDAYGFAGKGVFRIKNRNELIGVIERIFSTRGYKGISGHFYAQEYIESANRDLRVITIGNSIATAYWRNAKKGDWKANVSLGASVSFDDIPQKALDICLSVSRQMNYHWMSYDCFVVGNKVLINEMSPVFGVIGPNTRGINIRRMQVEYIIDKHKNYE